MTLLDTIPNTNTDCRKFKKDWGSNKANERDFQDWLFQHPTEYKFQNIIRKKYLYNYYPVQVRDLAVALRRDFLLSWEKIDLIMKHLISNNKYIHVEKNGEENFLAYHLYLVPRFPVNVKVPFSLLTSEYYDELRKLRGS
jgi:hypothetical protein